MAPQDDAPSVWELHRSIEKLSRNLDTGFSGVRGDLSQMATRDALAAAEKRLDGRIEEANKDIADESTARKEADAALAKAMDRTGMWVRWCAGFALAPLGALIFTYVAGGR